LAKTAQHQSNDTTTCVKYNSITQSPPIESHSVRSTRQYGTVHYYDARITFAPPAAEALRSALSLCTAVSSLQSALQLRREVSAPVFFPPQSHLPLARAAAIE